VVCAGFGAPNSVIPNGYVLTAHLTQPKCGEPNGLGFNALRYEKPKS
jgi:hypothetical protein